MTTGEIAYQQLDSEAPHQQEEAPTDVAGANNLADATKDLFYGYADKGSLGSISLTTKASASATVRMLFSMNISPALLGVPYTFS